MKASRPATSQWDVADYLRDEEEILLFIETARKHSPGDKAFMAKVMRDVERARRLNKARAMLRAENPEWTDQMVSESVRFADLPPLLQKKLEK